MYGGQVESLGSIADVSRTWRLVRNQQQQVEASFTEVNTRFSSAIRKLSGVKTIKTVQILQEYSKSILNIILVATTLGH